MQESNGNLQPIFRDLNRARNSSVEAINALKLPPVVTKKSEVLTKHLRETIKKDPGVAAGTVTCGSAGTHATNPAGVLAAGGVWFDNASAAPSSPTQSQLAAEAVAAAAHFGNTTTSSNATAQYVINTATHNNASGFGTQYCAWHSSIGSSYGTIAYTNMPYITDAGSSCGAGFNGLSAKAGITIVGGHEFAETETDIFPSGGWTDRNGAENADKCAWISTGQGASANITLGTGTFAVQSLWSNAFNGGAGGCVLAY